MCSRRQRTLPALALADAEQLHCGEPCGARAQHQPRRAAGFFPHEGLGAAALLVADQPQRPQGLELPGAVRRELRTGHRVAALDARGPKRKKLIFFRLPFSFSVPTSRMRITPAACRTPQNTRPRARVAQQTTPTGNPWAHAGFAVVAYASASETHSCRRNCGSMELGVCKTISPLYIRFARIERCV
jgi:hypothetical protein